MMYSDLYFQKKKQNGLIFVAIGVLMIFGIFLYTSDPSIIAPILPSRAISTQLNNHEMVNVSAHQVGIYWQSSQKEPGWVVYGSTPSDLNSTAIDERDIGGKKNNFSHHYVLLKGLKENTSYYYKIISGDNIIVGMGNKPFSFKTPTEAPAASTVKPAYGKVLLPNGQPAQSALVTIRYKDIVPLMTLTKVTGEWLIPMQYAVDKSTNTSISISEADKIMIDIKTEQNMTSAIEALVKNTDPLPQSTVMGKQYRFLQEDDVLPASTAQKAEVPDYPITILVPKENAIIPGSKPLLKGQAVPGKQVKIQINSQSGYISRIYPDKKGEWYVNTPVSFPAGTYIMTVTTEDAMGKPVTLLRKFTMAKSGEQVLGEATPSGTLTPSASPTATLALSPTIASASPTITLPLATATPISTASPTGLYVSGTPPGFNGNTVLFGGLGLVVVGLGVLLAF